MDLDRLNEEVRTRVYLSYFSNARAQIDEQRRRITFLQRLKDEESGDPHFRINAKQVFGDPAAYEKLMPWIDTFIETARARGQPKDERWTIGELVEVLLAEERHLAQTMEQGLNQIRAGFAAGGKFPLSLEAVTHAFPVEWSIDRALFTWQAGSSKEREPLRRSADDSRMVVDVPIHLCTVCQRLVGKS